MTTNRQTTLETSVPSPPPIRLSVLIPAYNEASRIAATVAALRSCLDPVVDHYEIIVVDDGSNDDTAGVAARAGARVIRLDENHGKGAALRTAVRHAAGRAVVFTDADLAYPPRLVATMLDHLETGSDMVVGSRYHPDSRSTRRRSPLRSAGGRLMSLLIRLLVLPEIVDTQCGIKGFTADVARDLCENGRVDGFASDVELFVMARRNGLTVTAVAVTVDYRDGSTVSVIGDTSRFVWELFRIRQLMRAGAYDLGRASPGFCGPSGGGEPDGEVNDLHTPPGVAESGSMPRWRHSTSIKPTFPSSRR